MYSNLGVKKFPSGCILEPGPTEAVGPSSLGTLKYPGSGLEQPHLNMKLALLRAGVKVFSAEIIA